MQSKRRQGYKSGEATIEEQESGMMGQEAGRRNVTMNVKAEGVKGSMLL
jgi:hypothetical protein